MSLPDGECDGGRPVSPWRKRAQLLRRYLAGRPVWCAWQVTYRCNFRCHFCQYWRRSADAADELTVGEFALGARKLAQWGAIIISLGGGEPLLRPDIVDIVRELARYHFVFLTTNGWLVTPELARRLYQAGLWGASVSLDYADPLRHDRQRGRGGACERARAALATFLAARTEPHQRVNLLATLVSDNLGEMEGLAALALEVGANFMVQPYSTLKTGQTEFLPQPAVSRQLLTLHDRYPNFLSHRRFLARFDAAVNGGVPSCRAGKSFFNIDERGQVAPCVEQRPDAVGNLLSDDLSTLSERLRRAARANRCQACWYNCRGEVEALYEVRGLLDALSTYLLGPRAEMALRGAAGGGQGLARLPSTRGSSAEGPSRTTEGRQGGSSSEAAAG